MIVPGCVYLDLTDGEIVVTLPPSSWRQERWGELPAGAAVVRVAVPAVGSLYEVGEVCGRVLTEPERWRLLRDAAGKVAL